MKFTLSWLKEHLKTSKTAAELGDALTSLGLELEEIEDLSIQLAPFKTAKIIHAEKHPEADKLNLCRVLTEDGEVQVVCGAPNAKTGLVGIFAPSGSVIPTNGMKLKPTKIRGADSNGMMCSEREMGLSDEHDGIIELPQDTEIGIPITKAMGLDDPVIDIAITPNRADCLGVFGVARDLAAAGHGELMPLHKEPVTGNYPSPISVHLDPSLQQEGWQHACPLFIGRHFKNIKNGPSPDWMQKRLTAIGLRPISALVDITNYVTFDLGRPLHVFDAEKVSGDLSIKLSSGGEKLDALNDKSYELQAGMTILCDENGPEAIGGVVGGLASGCTETTTSLFLEAAYFDPIRTAQTGRLLNVITDARYRFERGVDPDFVCQGMEIATRLILEICGGETSEPVIAGQAPDWQRQYILYQEKCLSLAGIDVPAEDQVRILAALGFDIEDITPGKWQVTPPSWRQDIQSEAHLVEEIIRVRGYDQLLQTALPRQSPVTQAILTDLQQRQKSAQRCLASRGLSEAVTFSFMSSELTPSFHPEAQPDAGLRLLNPISSDLDEMRPSILPNLLQAMQRNLSRGLTDSGLFEIGAQYQNATPKGQQSMVSGIRFGQTHSRHWKQQPRTVDAYDAKADVLEALRAAGGPADSAQITTQAPDWYHPGRSGAITLGKNVLAYFGELHPAILKKMNIKETVVGFELFLDNIPARKGKKSTTRTAPNMSNLQTVQRDFAFILDETIPADKLLRVIKGADKKLISDVTLFDVYQGKGIAEGQKSLALMVTLQPKEQTLTDAEIEKISDKIVEMAAKAGASLRS